MKGRIVKQFHKIVFCQVKVMNYFGAISNTSIRPKPVVQQVHKALVHRGAVVLPDYIRVVCIYTVVVAVVLDVEESQAGVYIDDDKHKDTGQPQCRRVHGD